MKGEISMPLDEREVAALTEMLGHELHTLREELARAEHREFKKILRDKIDALEALEAKLERARQAA